jgi:hypothetical protein
MDTQLAQLYINDALAGDIDEGDRLALSWAQDLTKQANPSFDTLPDYDFLHPETLIVKFQTEPTSHDPEREERLATQHKALKMVMRVFRELYLALCRADERYADAVKQLKDNEKPFITAVAGYLAATMGFKITVVFAVAAAIFRLVAKAQYHALCEFGSERFR